MTRHLSPLALALLAACATAPGPKTRTAAPPDARTEMLADVLAREDRRDARDGFLDKLLADPDPSLRRRACLALGRIGDPGSVAPVATLLADGDPSVRGAAAFALGEIADPAIVAPLLAALDERDASARARILEALTKAPTPEGSAAARKALAQERDPAVGDGALRYTFRFKDPAWIPLYLERATDELAALYALCRLDVKGLADKDPKAISDAHKDAYVQIMIRRATASDPFAAALAARGLGRFPEVKVPFREQALRGRFAHPATAVRVEALRGAAELLKGKGTVWPEIRSLADDASGSVRLTALETLGAIGGRDAEALLRERRRTGLPRERAVALGALFAMGPSYMDRDLTEIVQDEDWQQRIALATALAEPKLTYGLTELTALLADPDPRVRPAALSALASRNAPSAPAALRAALAADDPIFRATAADELSRRDDAAEMRQALRDSWTLSEKDRDNDARLALCDALAKAGMTVELAFALRDRDWLVRTRAAELLRQADGKKHEVAPLQVERRREDYLRALAADRPRTVEVATSRGSFTIELLWDDAPLTCLNFTDLVRRGYYDGLAYHRIVPAFVVQDGCPRGDGSGGPGWQIRCEVNDVRYGKGMVGMALSGKDTGGSQYFVTLQPTPHLDGGYTIFGRVTSGMDVVEALVQGDRTNSATLR